MFLDPRTGLLSPGRFTRPFDWFYDRLYTVLLSLVPCSLSLVPCSLSLVPVLLNYGPVLLIYGPIIDLPHASLLCGSQIPISVIIRCKLLKTGTVENTALSQMRSVSQELAC